MSLKGSIKVAGDKSITHRAIIFSSLSKGTTRIHEPLLGADCISTLEIFKQFGVKSELSKDCLIITSPGLESFCYDQSIFRCRKFWNNRTLIDGRTIQLTCYINVNW